MILKRLSLPTWLALLVTFVIVSGAGAAKLPDDKFWFRFEGFLVPGFAHDTTLRLDSEIFDEGTEISFEDDLGFDTEVVSLRVDGAYRFGKRHRVNLSFNWVNRNSTQTLEREIIFGDEVFEVGIDVDAKLDTIDIDLNYGFSFVRNDVAEVGASLGFHVLRVDSGIEIAGTGGEVGGSTSSDGKVTAPLPVIGLFGRGALSDRFFLNGATQLFAISIDRFSGHYFDIQGSLEYLVANHFIIGAGYTWNQMEINQDDPEDKAVWLGQINFTRSGPIFTVRFYW